MCCKNLISSISIPFALLIISVKILSNFEEEWKFNKEKRHLKNKLFTLNILTASNMQKKL